LALIVALSVVQKDKLDPHTVFIEVVNSTGWANDGFAFLFGFLRHSILLALLLTIAFHGS